MWYKNIADRFCELVRKHARDRPNYDSQDRASIAASSGKNTHYEDMKDDTIVNIRS